MAKQTFAEVEPMVQPNVPASQPIQASAPEVLPARSEFTKRWEVKHDYKGTTFYGAMRVSADSKEDAVAEFCRIRCPESGADLREQLSVREIPFRPAATEVGKPGGWRRNDKIKGGV